MRKIIFILFGLSFFIVAFFVPKQAEEEVVAALGRQLFFDKMLSRDSTIACASCHQPQFAFADNVAFSRGVGDSLGTRNTPSIMNMAFRPYFFYDGRSSSLEEQILVPIESSIEMHLDFGELVKRVAANEFYQTQFEHTFEAQADSSLILLAIAEFIRSLESDGSAPHDLWLNDIDTSALTESQIRGREVFVEKGKCFECHFGPDFTGDEFKNIGLFDGEKLLDKGRFEISGDSIDLGAFKVPGLRNITLTAPYMHNGMFATLEEVVDYYDQPNDFVAHPINRDTLLREPLNLTNQEKEDLINFLYSLTDPEIPYVD